MVGFPSRMAVSSQCTNVTDIYWSRHPCAYVYHHAAKTIQLLGVADTLKWIRTFPLTYFPGHSTPFLHGVRHSPSTRQSTIYTKQSINRVNVTWNNSFRHIFSGFWWESVVKPLQYYTAIHYRFHILQTKENCCSGENWPCITITFCYLFHGSCKSAFMPLAACMVLQQCRLQLVKLSRPFGLSLLRLFESFQHHCIDQCIFFS